MYFNFQYRVKVDVNAAHKNMPINLQWREYFGQLLYVFWIKLPATPPLGQIKTTTIVFAAIHKCDIVFDDPDLPHIHYYQQRTHVDIVDITTVKALVGRVPWDGWWAIIDRGAGLAEPPEGGDDGELGNEDGLGDE
jgi:hypothetical protein